MIRLFSLIVFLLATGVAQELPPGGATRARVMQHASQPEYTEEARVAGLEGMVVVQAEVGADGVPRDIRVAKSLGLGLDEKAVEAVAAWRFNPAMKNGAPVADRVTIEVAFSGGLTPAWHLDSALCDTPDEVSLPTVIHRSFPPEPSKIDLAKTEKDISVAVSFDVDESGIPSNLHVEKSSDEIWVKDVVAALRQWKFDPGVKDGKPVTARCTWDFVRNQASNQPKVVIR